MAEKSNITGGTGGGGVVVAELPWGSIKLLMGPTMVDPSVKPGEYVAQTLFLEFIAMAEKKIAAVSQEPIVSP